MARRGIKQEEMATALGCSQSNMSKRLRGVKPFTLDEVALVAQLLGLTTTALINDAEKDVTAGTLALASASVAPPAGLEPATLRLTVANPRHSDDYRASTAAQRAWVLAAMYDLFDAREDGFDAFDQAA